MLQGVLFDMDGLMFDTERIGRDGWHKAAEILHIDLPEGIIAAMRGTGTDRCREIFNAAIPGSLYDTAHDLRLRYADEVIAANGVPVKPGLRELLRRLKASDIPAVLATSTRREKALAYFRENVAPYLYVQQPTFLNSSSSDKNAELQTLMDRYTAGQINTEQFIKEADKKLRMMQMEDY